ncbi:bifunctional heptose 7-phosphate kinase/heptose 1-phosphate adenyltransferase [Raineya sp.]|jgi:rfaE bifunctional protein kinase chain/domain
MKSVQEIFKSFEDLRVLVIGDVMIDSYLWGSVTRISPEAPVPILNVQRREQRLGGAANVALNLQSLGAKPILCSVIGSDSEADKFLRLLEICGLSAEGITQSMHRITTVKHRILAASQHLLRIDSEMDKPIDEEEEEVLWQKIQTLLPQTQAVIFEDYDKGVITPKLIEKTIQLARKFHIPTIIDPKKRNFDYYIHSTLFKPNLKELKEGLKLDFENNNLEAIKEAVKILQQKLAAKYIMTTLSEKGVLIYAENEMHHIPAHIRNIADVSGAGDTVVSVAALCVALQLPAKIIAELSNLAGGIVCEYQGVVPIPKERLLAEAMKIMD